MYIQKLPSIVFFSFIFFKTICKIFYKQYFTSKKLKSMECEWMVYELQNPFIAHLIILLIHSFQLLSTSYIHCFRWQTDSNKHIFIIIKSLKLPAPPRH